MGTEAEISKVEEIEVPKLTPDMLRLKNPGKICQDIEAFIAEKVEELSRKGVALGLSGGVDSAVIAALSVRAVGSDKVLALYMPEKDSKEKHRDDAWRIADVLKINLETLDLSPTLENLGIYSLASMRLLRSFPTKRLQGWISRKALSLIESFTGKDPIADSRQGSNNRFIAEGWAYASIKHRLRMAMLHFNADRQNLLTAGAANQTEWLTGVFVKFGIDGVADIMPILPFLKTEVRQLAKELQLPQDIVEKAGDPDVAPGFNDKGSMFGSEETLDLVLLGLREGLSTEQISAALDLEIKEVEKVHNLMKASKHMRESPYIPQLSENYFSHNSIKQD